MATDRGWMYKSRPNTGGTLEPEFMVGVDEFIASALTYPFVVSVDASGNQCIPCPCERCDNLYNKDIETVQLHLYQHGFCSIYEFVTNTGSHIRIQLTTNLEVHHQIQLTMTLIE